MSGYVPLFDSIATGTLYGRWPDIGLWPIILALCNKNGEIDVTPQYLSGVTGLPLNEVIACMQRFCSPDPLSRTKTENGARLRLIDSDRDWGWVVVNHGKYREKARLMAKAAKEVEEGRNKARMLDRRGPPGTADDPLSYANANSYTNSKEETPRESARSLARRLPPNWELTPERLSYAKLNGVDPIRAHQDFCDYWHSIDGPRAAKLDWDATWRTWIRRDADRLKPIGLAGRRRSLAKSSAELEAEQNEQQRQAAI